MVVFHLVRFGCAGLDYNSYLPVHLAPVNELLCDPLSEVAVPVKANTNSTNSVYTMSSHVFLNHSWVIHYKALAVCHACASQRSTGSPL